MGRLQVRHSQTRNAAHRKLKLLRALERAKRPRRILKKATHMELEKTLRVTRTLKVSKILTVRISLAKRRAITNIVTMSNLILQKNTTDILTLLTDTKMSVIYSTSTSTTITTST